MPDKTTVGKLIERTPLAVVIIGVFVFIIGAAGGLPLGNPPLQVTDWAWRVGLGVIGLILAAAGLLLIVREERMAIEDRSKKGGRLEGAFFVKTYPRSQHPAFFAEVEKLVPRAKEITLIATGLNLIWEKHIVDILVDRAKSGEAKITICMGNPFSPYVQDRLIEEEMIGERAPVGRDGILRNVKALVQRLSLEGNPPGFSVRLFEHYPTFATLIFDKDIFIYPYAYQILGNNSPILHLRDDESEEARFFVSNAAHIIRDAAPAKDVITAHTNRKFYSDDWIAVAVYVVPDASEPLYQFGSSVLGYDIWRQMPLGTNGQDIADVRAYVGEASEYGFHATLADILFFLTDSEIERIKAELRMLTEEFCPFTLSNFKIADRFNEVGDIVILCDDASGVTEALHYELVTRVYRSALSSNYLVGRTRKKIPRATAKRAALMMQRYGSPYILKGFDLHFTLCSMPPADPTIRSKLVSKLQATFQHTVKTEDVEIDEVCLLVRRKSEKQWRIVAKYPLCGK